MLGHTTIYHLDVVVLQWQVKVLRNGHVNIENRKFRGQYLGLEDPRPPHVNEAIVGTEHPQEWQLRPSAEKNKYQ